VLGVSIYGSGQWQAVDVWILSEKIKKIDKDKYNPNTKVIDAQVVAAGGWSKYKGQILHLNLIFQNCIH
jgi:hypothetical protein